MTTIEFADVRKEYEDVTAVDDVSLTIEDGEFIVLLGPSGCGKSTTLRMLAGLEEVTSGEILFDDEPVTTLGPAERDLAMVFQEIALYPHMTVFNNIASPLRAAGEDSEYIDERVRETATTLEIGELLDRKPEALSGGQRQRVSIGRALVREPRGFLLDEPFSNLDQKLRVEMQKELKRLQSETGVTTIFVTHDQEEAMVLADRIVVMNDGALQQIDEPEALYRNPTNEFVADFIGNPTMNFFDVDVGEEVLIDGVAYPDAPDPERLEGAASMAARPEDVVPVTDPDGLVPATVDLVEPHGNLSYLICTHDGRELTIQNPEPGEGDIDAERGDRIGLTFDFGSANFYDERGQLLKPVAQPK